MDFLSFEGRIGRGEYWFLSILLAIGGTILFLISLAFFPPLALIVFLALVVSSWSIGARRCHDLGWSGIVQLVAFIPLVGSLFLFVALGFVPGQQGPTRYGYADGYVPQYIGSGFGTYSADPAATPRYLQQLSAVHPSLKEANERAWQSEEQPYRQY